MHIYIYIYMYIYIHVYIYIYIYIGIAPAASLRSAAWITANLRAKLLGVRGFDSSRILILRGEIPRPIGIFPEI